MPEAMWSSGFRIRLYAKLCGSGVQGLGFMGFRIRSLFILVIYPRTLK